MSFVPTGFLAQARTLANSSLPDTCTIQRKVPAANSDGTPSKSGAAYTNVHTNVSCRVRDYGSIDRPRFDILLNALQVGNVSLYIVILPFGTDALWNDQIVVNGKTLLVLGTDAITSYQVMLHALAKEAGA